MLPLNADFDGDTFYSITKTRTRRSAYYHRLMEEYLALDGVKRKAKHRAKLKKYLDRLM